MSETLSPIEAMLQEKYDKEKDTTRLPSSAREAEGSARVASLVLSDEERGRMPMTQDKYIVRENPDLVQWERETRKFLRLLSPNQGHRVSVVMIYEWATGINVKELVNSGGNANSELRKINKALRFYFGKSYQTYSAGRKVPNCYRVRPGYYIKRHRPMTITLYAEYCEGTLNP